MRDIPGSHYSKKKKKKTKGNRKRQKTVKARLMTRQNDKNLSKAVSNAIIIIAAVNHKLCDTAPWLTLAVQARKKSQY
jgi:hypothetical protein